MTSGQTFLGFDYGSRKIGVAVGQSLTGTARDLDTVRVKGSVPDWNSISSHVDTWQPSAFVVGIPLSREGQETAMSGRARKFGQTLSGRYNLPVHWVNEYLTSEAARALMPRSTDAPRKKDQIAARLILESFLRELESTSDNRVDDDLGS